MSKPVKSTILLLALLSLLTACATSRDVLYLQDIDKVQLHDLATRYEAVIKKDDELKIIITSADKTVTDPYNFTIGEVSSGFTTQSDPETPIMSCIVDARGDISFPILGRIHVEGGLDAGVDHALVTGETGVGVRAEHHDLVTVHGHFGSLFAGYLAEIRVDTLLHQSYRGRWTSNSSVQMECVICSMESHWPWV